MSTMDGHPTTDALMLAPADRRRWLLANAGDCSVSRSPFSGAGGRRLLVGKASGSHR
jgi:hypothetical protein